MIPNHYQELTDALRKAGISSEPSSLIGQKFFFFWGNDPTANSILGTISGIHQGDPLDEDYGLALTVSIPRIWNKSLRYIYYNGTDWCLKVQDHSVIPGKLELF